MFSIRIDHYIHQANESAILDRLATIESLIAQSGARIMADLQEQHALLDQINEYTNRLATQQEAQTAAITEIETDLDALIAQTSDETVKARLESLRDRAQTAAAQSTAQTDTLRALAAKHEEPLPPPVEPPPAA